MLQWWLFCSASRARHRDSEPLQTHRSTKARQGGPMGALVIRGAHTGSAGPLGAS